MLPLRPLPHLGRLLTVAALLLMLLMSLGASANNQPSSQVREESSHQGPTRASITAAQAADRAQRQFGGKVMGVQTRSVNGAVVYSVKILQPSGHMRIVNVNGQTGAIMN